MCFLLGSWRRRRRPSRAGVVPRESFEFSRPGAPELRRRRLAAESEPSDDGAVARGVLLHEVREKAATLTDELEEAAARMVVLGKAPEMLGERPDPLRQERDLDLR